MKPQELLNEAYLIKDSLAYRHPKYAKKLSKITFQIHNGMTRLAGRAYPAKNLIRLSYPYYKTKSNFDSDFRDTVTHELAHIIVGEDRINGIGRCQWHGKKWQAMHKLFGGNGNRCHYMKLTSK
jgi:predicted SprT family Zn-dependent metalloprotease